MTDLPLDAPEPLAIVGIGCHFPGGAVDPTTYWELLCAGVDATGEVPTDRWDVGKFYDPDPVKLGKTTTFRGGFLDRVDQFDPQFFGISPREAVWLDPQQRLLLRTAWEALEDAGEPAERLAGTDTGVFMAGFTLDYQLLQNYGVQSRYELQAHSATGMMMTMLANRVSHAFDLRGPSLTVDTACSGSLVALHLAAQSIWNGECATALVGGANVMLAPDMYIAESKGGFLAPDGRCKAFDISANGYARGEGAGVVVLKPLSRAIADANPIYATVVGSGVSQDGHTSGITVPSGRAQESAMRQAYARAGVRPGQVQYVEAHGTGTPVGDPIEAGAIGAVLSGERDSSEPLVIGSAKTNLGHLEAAAGIAGLIKAALALRHRTIPANLHLHEPNPAIDFAGMNMRVQTELGPWPVTSGVRHAGVNSFGFGGTNAHVVLREAPEPLPAPNEEGSGRRHQVIPLSARSSAALIDTARALREFLTGADVRLADVSHTSALRRSHHDHRTLVVAEDTAEALARLDRFIADPDPDGPLAAKAVAAPERKLAFVCSGMGPQWWAMGHELLRTQPVFRAVVERCDTELARYTGWSLLERMLADEHSSLMAETELAQPANFAIQLGLAELLKSWGVEPDAIVGHSAGEAAAQYLAGVLSFEDAVKVTYYRSALQQRASGQGRMLAVDLTEEATNRGVADAGPLVSVAAVNSTSAVTLSGDEQVLGEMARQLADFGVFHRFLNVRVPYHSHYMDPLRPDLELGLRDLDTARARVPLYSTVTGTRIDGRDVNAGYWWQNVRATVLFAAAVRQMIADGYTHFVELSPHPVLAGSVTELLAEADKTGFVAPTLRRKESENTTLLGAVGTVYRHGHQVEWSALTDPDAAFVRLPNYQWQLETYWNESIEATEDRHYRQSHPLLGQRLNAADQVWERELSVATLSYLDDHRVQNSVVLPGAAYLEMAVAAADLAYGAGTYSVTGIELRKALVLGAVADARLRTTLDLDDGSVVFASFLATPNGGREWTVHATARLTKDRADVAHHDLAAVRARCAEHLTAADFTERTTAMGFEYGPAFRCVTAVEAGPGVAIGRITVPESLDLSGYHCHPSLVDAAFQLTLAAADRDGEPVPYLPVGIDRVTFVAPPTEDMRAVVEVTSADAADICGDIALCAADGRTLVEIKGFRARSLAAATGLGVDQIDRTLYEIGWTPQPLTDTASGEPGRWLIFTDASGVGERLARRVRDAGGAATLVRAGTVRDVLAEDGAFVIAAADRAHYETVLAELPEIDQVVHLWSLDAVFAENDAVAALAAAQDTGVHSVTALMQALAASESQRPRVWLGTRGAQAVAGHPRAIAVEQAPLWGLGRVIGHQEFASAWGGLIDLDASAPIDEQAVSLFAEITAGDVEDQIAFRDGTRFLARLVQSDTLTHPFPVRLRADGGYLVTGGLGALGLLVAGYLVEQGAEDLILLGRTPMPAREEWEALDPADPRAATVTALLALEAKGARLSIAAVDIADEHRVREWYADYRAQGKPIRGVVHTAGLVSDELLVRMSRETFDRVLAPKLLGGWLVHRVFADEPLDFLVYFGSTGSTIAQPGQGNYAAGNAFLDALAAHRTAAGLPAMTIGWGPWSIGMVDELDLEQVYADQGIGLITPRAGVAVLGRLLYQRAAHVVAVTADWATVRAVAGNLPPLFAQLGTAADAGSAGIDGSLLDTLAALPAPQRPTALARTLHQVTATVLGLGVADFGEDDPLSSLGVDSMMAIQIKRRLDPALSIDLPVLELLEGSTITSLTQRVLGLVSFGDTTTEADTPAAPSSPAAGPDDELAALLAQVPADELERLIAELADESPKESSR
ncbi:type I polyketide synthase [Nocardia rhizosphaerae]|uniref:Type I polyketide synthase n=1 Tax=Nocardia rhizosphaerae TaxID=1691571 RepID=A0ABV8LAN1_9NOCA